MRGVVVCVPGGSQTHSAPHLVIKVRIWEKEDIISVEFALPSFPQWTPKKKIAFLKKRFF